MAIRRSRRELGGRWQQHPLRYSGKIIFFAQFVPVLRTLAGPFAGANLMPWRKFLFANAVSSGVWAATYGYAAYWLGGEFERLQGRNHTEINRRDGIRMVA
jgi:membrane protein DedA with SNARE-associated domain